MLHEQRREYTGDQNESKTAAPSVWDNTEASAVVCATDDDRTSRNHNSLAGLTTELSLLAPQERWQSYSLKQALRALKREKRLTIRVRLSSGESAFYLPSVWLEEKQWTPAQLLLSLAQKAARHDDQSTDLSQISGVWEIPVYEIGGLYADMPAWKRNRGYFPVVLDLLRDSFNFYAQHADLKRHRLAYLIPADGKVQYDNENAWVRSYADITAFYQVTQFLFPNSDRSQTAAAAHALLDQVVEDMRQTWPLPARGDLATIAARMELYSAIDRPVSSAVVRTVLDASTSAGIFDASDLTFSNPQIMLALAHWAALNEGNAMNGEVQKHFQAFLVFYAAPAQAAVVKDVFGANWISQAVEAGLSLSPQLAQPPTNLI